MRDSCGLRARRNVAATHGMKEDAKNAEANEDAERERQQNGCDQDEPGKHVFVSLSFCLYGFCYRDLLLANYVGINTIPRLDGSS